FLEDPTPLDQAYREVREEVGIAPEALRLEADGAPVFARDGASVFVVYPFLFRTATTELRLDWEHTRAEWVPPEEIRRRPTVPKLDRVWEVVTAARVTKG
ncbi:MAG TPA: NUDIX domain-containing protein, partial [Thermoplasmata archaeon]|nr:NUDIX domain-containing protein [Thermoplasmata archaeon]